MRGRLKQDWKRSDGTTKQTCLEVVIDSYLFEVEATHGKQGLAV